MNKNTLADTLLEKQRSLLNSRDQTHCFVGFDGFTDEIISVVESRENAKNFTPFAKISDFAQRLQDAAGKSCNIELIVRQKKIGGNAPIMANALVEGGHRITLAGMIGTKETIEPLFLPLAERCEEVFALAPSGHSDALEFNDGKIILGKLEHLKRLTADEIIAKVGREKFFELLQRSDLFVCANWTMLPFMNELWRIIIQQMCPKLTPKKRYLFVDFADPSKRSDADLHEALRFLGIMNQSYQVTLGLNTAEGQRIGRVLGLSSKSETREEIEQLAEEIRQKTTLSQIVIHARTFAAGSDKKQTLSVLGPHIEHIAFTTGGGDNFNAGYCNALLYGLDLEAQLLAGVATSGFYIEQGKSPTMEGLAIFLRSWDKSRDNKRNI